MTEITSNPKTGLEKFNTAADKQWLLDHPSAAAIMANNASTAQSQNASLVVSPAAFCWVIGVRHDKC